MKGRWTKKVHECRWPSVGSRGTGSEWRCRCGKSWRLVRKEISGASVRAFWRPLDGEA